MHYVYIMRITIYVYIYYVCSARKITYIYILIEKKKKYTIERRGEIFLF